MIATGSKSARRDERGDGHVRQLLELRLCSQSWRDKAPMASALSALALTLHRCLRALKKRVLQLFAFQRGLGNVHPQAV